MKKAYSIARLDRCGAKINEDLFVYAHCLKMGYDYIGPLGKNWFEEHRTLSGLLNIPLPFKDLSDDQELIHIKEEDYSKEHYVDVNDLISPDFLEFLRDKASPNIKFHTGRKNPKISIHIRRGDVSLQSHTSRYIPNSYFLDSCKKILDIFPSSEITIFSESLSSESFLDFEKMGCRLCLDLGISETWQEMINSDVFFMSKSSFSYVPAMYNKNIVVYYPAWYQKLNHWLSCYDQKLFEKINYFLSERYER